MLPAGRRAPAAAALPACGARTSTPGGGAAVGRGDDTGTDPAALTCRAAVVPRLVVPTSRPTPSED